MLFALVDVQRHLTLDESRIIKLLYCWPLAKPTSLSKIILVVSDETQMRLKYFMIGLKSASDQTTPDESDL